MVLGWAGYGTTQVRAVGCCNWVAGRFRAFESARRAGKLRSERTVGVDTVPLWDGDQGRREGAQRLDGGGKGEDGVFAAKACDV